MADNGDDLDEIWAWRRLLSERRWVDLHNWSSDPDHWTDAYRPSLTALVAALEATIPVIEVSNGVETVVRRLTRRDSDDLWKRHLPDPETRAHAKEAAELLENGELQAIVSGPPPDGIELWADYREKIESILQGYLDQDGPTTGEASMSRRTHAQDALDLLADIDVREGWALSHFGPSDDTGETGADLAETAQDRGAEDQKGDPEAVPEEADTDGSIDRQIIRELVAEVALRAFDAGRHTQAAWGKEFEPFALTGRKVKDAQREGARIRRGQTEEKTREILQEMERLVHTLGVSAAAEHLARKGIGTSAEANRKLYYRHKRR
jgi:hypothetical protein